MFAVRHALDSQGNVLIQDPPIAQFSFQSTKAQQVNFDLVTTVGFSTKPGAVLVSTADVIHSAGVTPVVFLSAHTLDPVLASHEPSFQAAGG
jgi:hypothetical protein